MSIDKKLIKEIQLDREEIEILEEQEKNEWIPVNNLEEIKQEAQKIAKNTIGSMKKNKSITIRINDAVLNKIKAKSLASGIPYQTLITEKINELAFYNTVVKMPY
jgi:predicted DNA binding CopG/RHH family protein